MKAIIEKLDKFQQAHGWAAFPLAVWKKFGDDQAGNLAALIAYYGFFSLFPLLLALTTILGFVLQGNAHLEQRILHSALGQFPVIGNQLQQNIGSLKGSGLALGIGLAGALYGGLAVTKALQTALNQVWEVPMVQRPGFFPALIKSVLSLFVLGVGILGTTVLAGLGSGSGSLSAGVRVAALVISLALNIGIFSLAFRVLTARDVAWNHLLPGAVIAAVAWAILQGVGGYYVGHQLKGASQTYGLFAMVIGLLSWLYLEGQIVLFCAEINVVRAHRLYPRSLTAPPLTDADKRAYKSYVQVEERLPEQAIDVRYTGQIADESEVPSR